jgi:catechol 2,3-dioxygenase-like lactoylglutathione lyase family enzyme
MENLASIRFDHFAYPVDDLVKAEDFYTGVLEVPIYERRGLRVIDVRAGTLPRTFLLMLPVMILYWRMGNRVGDAMSGTRG